MAKSLSVIKRIFLFVFALVVGGLFCAVINNSQARLENYLYAQISQPVAQIVLSQKADGRDMELAAAAAYSLRVGASGRERVIFRKNIKQALPIASLTKLMTALVVLEHPEIYDLDRQITISGDAAIQNDVPVFGNLIADQIYTTKELLHLMLFYSSNDAAFALSEVMGVDKFVNAMNQKAKELDMESAEFYNPSGLDLDDGTANQMSAKDLMFLTKHILDSHPEIIEYTIQRGPYITENGIFSLKLWDGQKIVGGKTGYTPKAGGCMILILKNDNQWRYFNILLGASSTESRVVEMQKLINYASNSDSPHL